MLKFYVSPLMRMIFLDTLKKLFFKNAKSFKSNIEDLKKEDADWERVSRYAR